MSNMPKTAYLMRSGGEKIWSAQHYMEGHGTKYVRADLVQQLVDALKFIENGCLVPPDGGSPDLQDARNAARKALEGMK